MGARDDIGEEVLARGQAGMRGCVAADPGLLKDDDRYRATAARVARDACGPDAACTERLERVLVAMRDQLVEAGS